MSTLSQPLTADPGPLRRALDERLQPPFLWMAGAAVLVMAVGLLAVSFATSDRGRTLFGPPLGADFAGFFAAAQILEAGEAARLYDRALHDQFYHALLPNLAESQTIPYVHPPFVAAALRPFTRLPYEAAFAVWLVVSGGLYLAGLALAWHAAPSLPRAEKWLVVLLAFTFEPFLLECWMGGQLSAVGFFSLALAFFCWCSGRPFAAGLALGLCLYKPTFLVLFLPLLLVSRQGRVLLGFAATGLALAALSVAAVGLDVCLGYADVLLAFRKSTSGADGLELRTWKYVDLNSCLQLLVGSSPWRTVLLGLVAAAPLALLVRLWMKWDSLDDERRVLAWAAALTWTPVLNLYVGVYDSVIVVLSALLTADVLYRRSGSATPLRSSGLAYVLLLVGLTPWFSQALARAWGVQVYTLALVGLGVYQFWLARGHLAAELARRGRDAVQD